MLTAADWLKDAEQLVSHFSFRVHLDFKLDTSGLIYSSLNIKVIYKIHCTICQDNHFAINLGIK